jgi:hypothetical protein
MTDFVHVDNLYRIRNALGARLEDVGEMLIESNPLLGASSFDRERAVRKHVGDYTLFMAGLFPESVARTPRARRPSLDLFVDFIKAGKESYAIVSSFDQFEYRDEAPLFRRLSESFELCVLGLNLVKQDLEQLQQKHYGRLKERLADNTSWPTQWIETNSQSTRLKRPARPVDHSQRTMPSEDPGEFSRELKTAVDAFGAGALLGRI